MGVGELSSVEKLKRLFEAFNERRDFLHLLDHSLKAQGVQIFIGHESGYQVLDDYSLVTAPYSLGGPGRGGAGSHRSDAHGLRARHPHRRCDREIAGRRLEFAALTLRNRLICDP